MLGRGHVQLHRWKQRRRLGVQQRRRLGVRRLGVQQRRRLGVQQRRRLESGGPTDTMRMGPE